MIFLAKNMEDLTPEMVDHIRKTYLKDVPFERDIIIGYGETLERVEGDWLVGNMEKERAP